MPQRKGLLAPQNTFLDTIATRFDGTHSNFVLGNAEAKDYPIVYCSDGFLLLTKYSRASIMSRGSECRFLWGADTTEQERAKIASAFSIRKELKTELIFYKKTGEKFMCLLDVVPIKNEKGQVVLFLVSHKDLTPKDARKNSLGEDSLRGTEQLSESVEQLSSGLGDESPGRSGGGSGSLHDDELQQLQLQQQQQPPSSNKYQRRRSRAVLYHLQGQYNGKRKNKKLNRFQNLHGGVTPAAAAAAAESLPEYKVDERKRSCFVFQHYGPMKIIWDWVLLAATFYVAVMVPFHAAVQADKVNSKDSVVMDIIVEILFITDIVFNFRTTYVSKSGQIVYDQQKIAVNYLKGWFIVDLLAAIPFDIINLVFQEHSHSTIQLMKLTRMLRLARLMQKIDRYYQYSAVVLILLIAMFGLCAHWLACIWYYIGQQELNRNDTRYIGWMFELSQKINQPYSVNRTGGPNTTNYFITALYFTCSSLTSVGFGNVSANTDSEKLFSICIMLMGALMHAAIFGNVTALIQRMYARRTAYQSKHRDLKEFIRTHRIPKKLKQRMLEFFQTMWALNHGIDSQEVLRDFSVGLRGDIAIHMNREVLGLKIFEQASQGCLKALAQRIRSAFYTPGEFLVHTGDTLDYIYFVCSGSLEILEHNEVVALLGKNDWFGTYVDHLPSFTVVRSRCDVKALTYCDLQCIEMAGLRDIFTLYPDFRLAFAKFLYQDLSFNIQEGANPRFDNNDLGLPNGGIVSVLPSISEDDDEYSLLPGKTLSSQQIQTAAAVAGAAGESGYSNDTGSSSGGSAGGCLLQQASHSDHMINSLRNQGHGKLKTASVVSTAPAVVISLPTELRRVQDTCEPSTPVYRVPMFRCISHPVLSHQNSEENPQQHQQQPLFSSNQSSRHSGIAASAAAQHRRQSFELSRRCQIPPLYPFFSQDRPQFAVPEFDSGSDAEIEELEHDDGPSNGIQIGGFGQSEIPTASCVPSQIRQLWGEMGGVRQHIGRLEDNIVQMSQSMEAMRLGMERILTLLLQQQQQQQQHQKQRRMSSQPGSVISDTDTATTVLAYPGTGGHLLLLPNSQQQQYSNSDNGNMAAPIIVQVSSASPVHDEADPLIKHHLPHHIQQQQQQQFFHSSRYHQSRDWSHKQSRHVDEDDMDYVGDIDQDDEETEGDVTTEEPEEEFLDETDDGVMRRTRHGGVGRRGHSGVGNGEGGANLHLLNIGSCLLEQQHPNSKLSPRSISSGFVSNQEDGSPKEGSSQLQLAAVVPPPAPVVKVRGNCRRGSENETGGPDNLNHQDLMQRISQICRMQSLPESCDGPPMLGPPHHHPHHPPIRPCDSSVTSSGSGGGADNGSTGAGSSAFSTRRRISSPIPFIKSTNL